MPAKKTTKSSKTAIVSDELDIDTDLVKKDKVREISQEGFNNLTNELNELKLVKMPQVVDRIKEARSYGDLSENAEYDAALEEKNIIESRIIEIQTLLSDVVIIDEKDLAQLKKSDRIVRYGSVVSVTTQEGKDFVFKVVSTGEVRLDPTAEVQTISFDSPLGVAIEGKKIGQTVKVRAEKGRYDVTIKDIN